MLQPARTTSTVTIPHTLTSAMCSSQQHAKVHGNRYGTSVAAVETVQSAGRVCILDIDVQGCKLIKAQESPSMAPHYVFIAPPSLPELEKRLRGRGTEDEAAVTLRIANAAEELRFGLESGYFEKVIVNDQLDQAYAELLALVKEWYPSYDFSAAASKTPATKTPAAVQA